LSSAISVYGEPSLKNLKNETIETKNLIKQEPISNKNYHLIIDENEIDKWIKEAEDVGIKTPPMMGILKQIEKTIDLGYNVVLWPDDIKEKDINDMILAGRTKEEVQSIINKNSYQGNMAKIRFVTWRKRNAR